jgi:hypothetical protein
MRLNSRTALALPVATFLFYLAPSAQAHDRHHQCSLWSVAGAFGYVSTGTRIGLGPVAGAGVVTFEDDGSVSGEQTVSFNGTIATETYSGTYTVGEDCRGSFSVAVVSSVPAFNRTTTVDVIWEDGSNAAHAIFTNPGTIITVDARRIFTRGN